MNTSQYMDKQIMDLSASGSSIHNKDFSDLKDHSSHQDDEERERDRDRDRNLHVGGDGDGGDEDEGISKEEIVPSYDFQPIRPLVASSLPKSLDGASRTWGSADSKVNSSPPVRNYSSVDTVEPTKVILEKDRNTVDAVMVAEIDRTMKKYADHLLHVLEGVNARLTQLETSVNDLKVSAGNNQGNTEGKMQHLENILREVQAGVQIVKDKQEIVEAQLHLGTFQIPRVDPKSEYQKSGHIDSMHLASSTPQQLHQLSPVNLSEPPHVPPPPPVQPPNQFPQNQIPSVPQREPYFPPPGQTPEIQHQQYQLPLTQQPHAPPASLPHQQYQPAPHQQYSQPPQQHPSLPPINPPPQLQSSLGHHSEESPYVPSQTYPPTPRPSSSGPPPSQQFYGPPSHLYEAPASRPNSGFATGYGQQPSGHSELYPYGGAPSQYGSGPTVKPLQLPSPAGGGSGYPQLPTARVLPQALPASGAGGGSGSPGGGNRVPVDDVIDRVTTMGFPREHVRATVRKLTESGQSVDLNVVLDKLMNEGGEAAQSQRSWPYAR